MPRAGVSIHKTTDNQVGNKRIILFPPPSRPSWSFQSPEPITVWPSLREACRHQHHATKLDHDKKQRKVAAVVIVIVVMGKRSRGGKRRKKRPPTRTTAVQGNFWKDAGPGCFMARLTDTDSFVEWESGLYRDDFDGNVPDIAVDPDSKTVTVCNLEEVTRVAIVSVFGHECFAVVGGPTTTQDDGPSILSPGVTVDADGNKETCTTFIVLCPPHTFACLCRVECKDLLDVRIENDVQPWRQHPFPADSISRTVGFPLAPENGPYLCTQGEGGILTHFFSGNLHAIDFRCPVGTPLLAVGDGTVVQTKDDERVSGIAVSNLFRWNSILLCLDGQDETVVVEYVHIQSSAVRVGDKVKEGDVIGTSGSVGFSPEPHLHFAAYRSVADDAPTVGLRFRASSSLASNTTFLPKAGKWYNADGPVEGVPIEGSEIGGIG